MIEFLFFFILNYFGLQEINYTMHLLSSAKLKLACLLWNENVLDFTVA